jgi:methionyl-tRNA formyltransferase
MKILVVTSNVTFVRDNYYHLLKTLREKAGDDIAGLLVIDNLNVGLLLKALAVFLVGARRIGGILMLNSLTSFAKKREKLFSHVFYSKKINHPDTLKKIRAMAPDLIINLRTREIYGKELLSIPPKGCINVHHGILPDNRGAMCDLWALYEKRDAGFSIHVMTETIDAGHILDVETVNTKGLKDYSRLPLVSSYKEADCLLHVIHQFKTDSVQTVPNIGTSVRYTTNPTIGEILNMKRSGLLL